MGIDIYNRIDDLLDKKGKSRRKMCEEINLSYNTLNSFFKRNSENINLDTLRKIACYLNTSLDYLIMGSELTAESPITLIAQGEGKIEYRIPKKNIEAAKIILEKLSEEEK